MAPKYPMADQSLVGTNLMEEYIDVWTLSSMEPD